MYYQVKLLRYPQTGFFIPKQDVIHISRNRQITKKGYWYSLFALPTPFLGGRPATQPWDPPMPSSLTRIMALLTPKQLFWDMEHVRPLLASFPSFLTSPCSSLPLPLAKGWLASLHPFHHRLSPLLGCSSPLAKGRYFAPNC